MVVQTITFSFATWFGLYILGRDPKNRLLRYSSLGLCAYALALAVDLFAQVSQNSSQIFFNRFSWSILFLPPIFWSGAIIHWLPKFDFNYEYLHKIWKWGIALVGLIIFIISSTTNLLWSPENNNFLLPGYILFGAINLVPLITTVWLYRVALSKFHPRFVVGILLAAALFFTLGIGLIILQLDWLPQIWILFGIGFDLELLGLAVSVFNAFDQGERFLPDYFRSLTASTFLSLVFGGQVAFAMAISTGVTMPMTILLLAVITAAILIQVFFDSIQGMLDRIFLARFPIARKERANLRAVADAIPRVRKSIDKETIEKDDFVRLTRRALSNFGDLPKLASSPLTQMQIIDKRLQKQGIQSNTLERTNQLKSLLVDSISKLKPKGEADFGSTDEWRFFNALYYPYVIGLKPYSRRADFSDLSEDSRLALDWFRGYVPERTLYNWQNAAAELIAQDLREQEVAARSE